MDSSATPADKKRHKEMDKVIRRLGAAQTKAECIDVVYEYCLKNNKFPELTASKKDDANARQAQRLGDGAFCKKDYLEALHKYTHALMNAKSRSCKAQIYANRSAALFKLELFKECVIDCSKAINYDYPEDKRPKLLARMSQAEQKNRFRMNYHEEIPFIPESARNTSLRNTSDSVEVRTNERYGRHLVATRDIEIGEVLIVEKAYANVPLSTTTNHCQHCLKLCYNLIPCDNCTWMLFCSTHCKNIANKMYHKYECQIVPTLTSIISLEQLSILRMMLRGFHEFLHEELIATDDSRYHSDIFKDILQTRFDLENMSSTELFPTCYDVSVMFHLVKAHTDFLAGHEQHERFKELLLLILVGDRIVFKSINLKIPKNCVTMATGIYPTLSNINHSCSPNLIEHFYGSTMVVRAIRTIKKSEQCFRNYGHWFYKDPKGTRQMNLLRQGFTCTCEACTDDWSTLMSLPPGYLNADKCLQLSNILDDNFNSTFVTKILPRIKKLLKYAEGVQPSFSHVALTFSIVACYNILGNKKLF